MSDAVGTLAPTRIFGVNRVVFATVFLLILPWCVPFPALAINLLVFGLYALSFNLIYGFLGLLSLGHAALFGSGAYACGIALTRFGVPWWGAIAAGIVAGWTVALAIGLVATRTRGIYFAMVTLALAQCVYFILYQASDWTGGENGLRGVNVKEIRLPGVTLDFLNPYVRYYVLMVFVVAALFVLSRILGSPFGAAMEAVRENESRARACGYNIAATRLQAFTLSGGFAGLAGALYALHLSIVPIELLDYSTSGLAVMMALLGGAGTFFGPFLGAAVFVLMENVVSLYTEHWQLFVGLVFIACVLFFPKGVWGTLLQKAGAWRN